MTQIQEIPLTLLKKNPAQKRRKYGDIKGLADTIAQRGLQNPISVVREGEIYIIVSGHRRAKAFEYLHKKTIPAIIRADSSQKDLTIDIAIENLQRKDLTPPEKAETMLHMLYTIPSVQNNPSRALTLINQIKLYRSRDGFGNDFTDKHGFQEVDLFIAIKLLAIVGVSPNTAITYLRILQLPEDIKDNIVFAQNPKMPVPENKISIKTAYELTRITNSELQTELYDKIKSEKIKHTNLKYMVDEIIENEPAFMNINLNSGTAARRLRNDAGAAELTKKLFELSSTVWTFRAKLPIICRRLDKSLWVAALTKMKKTCLEMVANINQLLKDDLVFEDHLELVNADLELQINQGKDGFRFSIPRSKAEMLELRVGDKLFVKIEAIERYCEN